MCSIQVVALLKLFNRDLFLSAPLLAQPLMAPLNQPGVAAGADGGNWHVSCSVALTRHPVPRSPARVYHACCKDCSAA